MLDFFHLDLSDRSVGAALAKEIEAAMREDRLIHEVEEEALPKIQGTATLERWDHRGRFLLQVESVATSTGLIHKLTYQIYKYLGANIFGLTAYTAQGTDYISIYHDLPENLSLEEAQAIVASMIT